MPKITWYGHSAFKIDLADKTLLVDPMLNQNPNSPIKANQITQADAVYVTHDHSDHLGDSFDICRRTDAVFVGVFELAEYAKQNGVKKVARLNVGGSFNVGDVKLTVVQAIHSAAKGTPTGVIIQGEDVCIYHAGDTALFGDMKLIGDLYRIDLACIPVGGNYTMDANQAVEAAKMLNARMILPMHYATMPVLAKDTSAFNARMRSELPNVRVISLRPGDEFEIAPAKELPLPT